MIEEEIVASIDMLLTVTWVTFARRLEALCLHGFYGHSQPVE